MKKNNIGLIIQASLSVFLIAAAILYLFIKELLPLFQILISLFMFTTAYNNQKTFKQKYITIAYIICGLAFLGAALIG